MPVSSEFWRDPAMPYVESRRACHSRACYKAHAHATVSIGAVDAGASVLLAAGHAALRLPPGSVVWIPAQQVHSCNPLPDADWSYQMLHLSAAWVAGEGAAPLQSAVGPAGLWAPVPDGLRISQDSALYAQFTEVNGLLFAPGPVAAKQAALRALVQACHTMDLAAPQTASRPAADQALKGVLAALKNAPGAAIDWDAVAQDLGMSRTQLIRAFRRATGMTPHAWQQNLRINAARTQICGGHSLAEVAYAQGFADQAHFQRVFKGLAGTTPGSYRG